MEMQLAPNTSDLSEVVVTALGIKRELKSLGYASQQVKGFQILQGAVLNSFIRLLSYLVNESSANSGNVPDVVLTGKLWWDE